MPGSLAYRPRKMAKQKMVWSNAVGRNGDDAVADEARREW